VEATRAYRELLLGCERIFLVYPVWWGGLPAVLKGFVDRTFVSGQMYSFEGRPPAAIFPRGLMRDHELHAFYTLDTPWLLPWLDPGWWSLYFSVFQYCGFRKIRRYVLPRLKAKTAEQREAWLAEVRRHGVRLGAAAGPSRRR
jgi:NAD(P)H dehydrogenase (quinone)